MENEEIKNPEEYWRDHWKDHYERLYELDCELIREIQKFSWFPLIVWVLVVGVTMVFFHDDDRSVAAMIMASSGFLAATLSCYIMRPQMPPWWGKMNRS